MKNFIFICCILIILFKTETVLSDNNIFNVNNIQISKETSKNKEKLISDAFKKAFDELINRLLLEEDYKRISKTNLEQIKKIDEAHCKSKGKSDKIGLIRFFNKLGINNLNIDNLFLTLRTLQR